MFDYYKQFSNSQHMLVNNLQKYLKKIYIYMKIMGYTLPFLEENECREL